MPPLLSSRQALAAIRMMDNKSTAPHLYLLYYHAGLFASHFSSFVPPSALFIDCFKSKLLSDVRFFAQPSV